MSVHSAKFQKSAPGLPFCPMADLPEFAPVGGSNVGKSSLLNVLAGAKALAKVSETPGDGRREVLDCISGMLGGLAPDS